jgi:beta-glucosidase
VRRILALKFEMGLFENPRRPDRQRQKSVIATAEHRAQNLSAARQCLVLLKNDDILPLSGDVKRVAVVGPNADNALAQLGD